MSIDVAGGWFRDNWIAKPYRIVSAAMIPTLMIGDHLYIDPRAYADREPARGDIVVFRCPGDPSKSYIKRVVGLPGDRAKGREFRACETDQVIGAGVRVDDGFQHRVVGAFGNGPVAAQLGQVFKA
ncbi:MAG: signal peptidase I [Proteobacteria bacterium]|nr:signal peptidase I [Pseudomonadota bacterium]